MRDTSHLPPPHIYFERALRNFHAAAAHSKAATAKNFAIAGKIVRFAFATPGMARHIGRGLAHLEVPDEEAPDLTVYAWDSDASGQDPLRPGWDETAYGLHGRIDGFNDDRFHTVMQLEPHILRLIDFERGEAIYWMPTTRDLPVWEVGAPARPLLHEWLRHYAFVPVHGGAVGTAQAGVFLAGAGGSGKSNLALSCLPSALRYASDDFCVLSYPPWTVHSLYNSAKIAAADLSRHPYLEGLASNPARLDREKALFFLQEQFAGKLIRSLPLKAIVLPRVTKQAQSVLVPASAAAAQKAIAMSTIQMSRAAAGFTFASVARFVRDLPCYELQIGAEPEAARQLLEGLVAELTPA